MTVPSSVTMYFTVVAFLYLLPGEGSTKISTVSAPSIVTSPDDQHRPPLSDSDSDEVNPSTVTPSDPMPSSSFNFLSVGLPVIGVVIVLGLFVGAYVIRKLRQQGKTTGGGLSVAEVSRFNYGIPKLFKKLPNEPYVSCEHLICQPYDQAYERGEGDITIDWTTKLGAGHFGVVLQGTEVATGLLVAVKTVIHPSLEEEAQEIDHKAAAAEAHRSHVNALLSELKVLIYLGSHEHVVNLVGAQTTRLHEGIVFLFVEYCPLGDLEEFLRQRRNNFYDCAKCGRGTNAIGPPPPRGTQVSLQSDDDAIGDGLQKPGSYLKIAELDPNAISVCDLVRWSAQAASAMEYLDTRRVLHGDLATRNILLLNKNCIKLTDFGLSKQLYNYTDYVRGRGASVPWRSMAPESLRDLTFSTQSDVWSFGVTLWEIFSLGNVPYAAADPCPLQLVKRLQDGERLPKPDAIPTEDLSSTLLYEDVMLRCWSMDPKDRPTFTELRVALNKMVQMCKPKGSGFQSEPLETP